jgi:hypothetical protein
MSEPRNAPKRYDMVTNYRCGQSVDELEPSDDGEWVRFEDIDPSVPLSAIRALVQQWRERVAVCLRISAEVGATGDMALAQAWHEEADHKDECANELAALCPAPPEET